MFKNILLGVDGSDHSLRAASLAGELARLMKSDLCVVVCYEAVPDYLGDPYMEQAMANRMVKAQETLQPALEAIGEIPGQLKTNLLEGPPAEAILAAAEARQSDLIIMGTRGLGKLAGLLVGSQSQKVLSHANCPVLLVR
jgi:nucleotide-binding universal stress UspA family protein